MSQKLSSIMLQVRVRPPVRQLHPKSGLPKSHAPGPGTLKKGLTVRGRQRFSGPGMSPGNGQENRVLITPVVRVKQGEAVKAHELRHALLENVRSVRLRAYCRLSEMRLAKGVRCNRSRRKRPANSRQTLKLHRSRRHVCTFCSRSPLVPTSSSIV